MSLGRPKIVTKEEEESRSNNTTDSPPSVKDQSNENETEPSADTVDDEDAVNEQGIADEDASSNNATKHSARRKGANRGKKARGSLARSKAAKASQSTDGDIEEATAKEDVQSEEDAEERATEEGAVEDGNSTVKQEDNQEDAFETSTESGNDETKRRRQRSASGLKELAGLGLHNVGDGSEEPLMPRRSRRSAMSPAELEKQEEDTEEPRDTLAAFPKEEADVEKLSQSDEQAVVEEGEGEKPRSSQEEDVELDAIDDAGEEGVTRCLCGSSDENVGLMIQCETCKCWQHCICMGMRTEEDCPDVYFCEQCRPELHVPLLKLLGFFNPQRSLKKGMTKSRTTAKDAAKELKEAKDAVLLLAKENERRRKEGREAVTGWSVAQEHEQAAQLNDQAHKSSTQGQKRHPSEHQRYSRSGSRDDAALKSPPKRRNTMNSRDSVYGWEPIPPGLLNEDEVWEEGEKEKEEMRKRKRVGRDEETEASLLEDEANAPYQQSKRRRTSGDRESVGDDGGNEKNDVDNAEASESQPLRRTQSAQKRNTKDSEKPKHPNQYTKRTANATNGSSPSPSPHKRGIEGSRRQAAIRDVTGSRTSTPTPAEGKTHTWGLPDHLSTLAYLLPPTAGPDNIKLIVPSSKSTNSKNVAAGTSGSERDPETDRIRRASPQPYSHVHLTETPAKVKYPTRRMTLGEMRKRVRNVLDFVSRLQIESVERERRLKFLGISNDNDHGKSSGPSSDVADKGQQALEDADNSTKAPENEEDTEMNIIEEQEAHKSHHTESATASHPDSEQVPEQIPEADPEKTQQAPHQTASEDSGSHKQISTPTGPSAFADLLNCNSMELVDELTRELVAFQNRFENGSGPGVSV